MATATKPALSCNASSIQAFFRPIGLLDNTDRDVLSWIRQLGTPNTFDADAIRELVMRAKTGDEEAQNAVILANIRLVYTIAVKFSAPNCDLWDLMQVGVVGVIKGIRRHDPARDTAFSSSVVYSIRAEIGRYVRYVRTTFHVPEHAAFHLDQIARAASSDDDADLYDAAHALGDDHDEARAIIQTRSVRSLDAPSPHNDEMFDGDPYTLYNTIPSGEETDVDVEREEARREVVAKLHALLPPREYDVIAMRFGLAPYRAIHSLDQAGKKIGVSRERVRQIELAAMAKLHKAVRRNKADWRDLLVAVSA